MIDPKKTNECSLVRHIIKGYIGKFDGVTKIQALFEKPSDTVGCRVNVVGEIKIRIASPDNLELVTRDVLISAKTVNNISVPENLSLEERHKFILESYGIEWKGICTASKKRDVSRQRVTHCWFCKHPLDSSVDKECVACGWILCQCGACGCAKQT